MEGSNNAASEQPGNSHDGDVVAAAAIQIQRALMPRIENLIRNTVEEVHPSILAKILSSGNRNSVHKTTTSTEYRSLQLKFLDEVSAPVLTGKKINGKKGTQIRVAILDEKTAQSVNSGPEASAKVEILVLEASENENELNWSIEDFNSRIIGDSDKKKPHLSKGMYVYLEKGIGTLCNVKMGHNAIWTKNSLCRLGARIVDNFNGSTVREAWTESFMVQDKRGKLHEKHHSPSLCDDIWRLQKISKNGAPCKRLNQENITTVRDFLFIQYNDPQRLQKIIGASAKALEATVDHAKKCIIDDKKIYFYPSDPHSESDLVVSFNVVGQLRGIIRGSGCVPIENPSEAEKASARELVLLAFENWKDVTFSDDETSLVQFSYESGDNYVPMGSGISSQAINSPSNFSSDSYLERCGSPWVPNERADSPFLRPHSPSELWKLRCTINFSETSKQTSFFHIRFFRVAYLVALLVRLRKRATKDGDNNYPKRQRIGPYGLKLAQNGLVEVRIESSRRSEATREN